MNSVAQPCRMYMDYRKFALQAAKDLQYSKDIIDQIKNAKSDYEIANIMTIAAKNIQDPE